jgi:enterochelin esterase-like enzyme
MMLALALLSSFIGTAVGANLGQILLDPLYRVGYYIWRRFLLYRVKTAALPNQATTAPVHTTISIIGHWFAAGGMIVLLVLASGSGDLFLFSPDVGLHTVPHVQTNTTTPGVSSIVQDSVVSKALGGQRKPFQVYLPPSYNTPIGKTRYYPTLYLLHGSPGKDIDWLVGGKAGESADTLIASGKIPELILVFPDGNGRPGATSEWGNSFDKRQLIETYVVDDLVKYVDQHYRTIPDPAHRAIGGLSMGGFGAINIAIHNPDVFGSAISLGGYYYAEGAIWGKNARYMVQNSPADTIQSNHAAWKLHIFLGAASKDQPYYNDTKQFMQILDKLHISYGFDLENGYHAWSVWQAQLYKALIWLQWG